jgi:DNA-binding transcriptional MocR family regulator
VIPNFHNPAGCTLSAGKRERLVALAAEHGFTIFEDDPYRLISFGGEELPTMLSMDEAGRVIHASSFSKTVSPGVRVGYLAGPPEEIATLAKRGSENYISPNMLAESVVLELCRSGALEQNVAFVNGALRERRDALVEAIRAHLPEAEFVVPEGGYFLWLDLPGGKNARAVLHAAQGIGVSFIAGPDFYPWAGGGLSSARLAYSFASPAQLREAVRRLAGLLSPAAPVELRQQHAA